jgi:hypothetical protein
MIMFGLKLYQDLKNAESDDQRYQLIAQAIEEIENQKISNSDLSRLPTKEDLKKEILELELRIQKEFYQMQRQLAEMQKQIADQTWKLISGLAVLGVIFKLADMVISRH